MTRLLLASDGSDAARAAIEVAAALFPQAEGTIATVHPPPPSLEAAAMARIALPDAMIREGVAQLRAESEREGREALDAGMDLCRSRGLRCAPRLLSSSSPWRSLRAAAAEGDADVIACGTRGGGPVDRVLLGSTASTLLHHADRPLLVVPAGSAEHDGPVLAGYDGSDGARAALRFAAAHLAGRRIIVAHAWRSPVRHSLRGQTLVHSRVEMFEDYARAIDDIWSDIAKESAESGVAFARELGLEAEPLTPESGRGAADALLGAARVERAAVVLAGSRGRGAVASTILGSVASGLVNAATIPVLVIPETTAGE
jgi:nucleotide-binding universal stress UspA family protein